ncbi:LysE family translocator [Amycolatopsis sp. NPDC004368]
MEPQLISWSNLGGFAIATLLGSMIPGSTTALIIRRSAIGGPRAALPVVVGIEGGLFLWVLAASAGLAGLVAASEVAYTVLRICGAAVLVALGVQAWLASRHTTDAADTGDVVDNQPKAWRSATTGLVTNVTNPKIAVFMFAFYPQFIPPGENVLVASLFLGGIAVIIDGSWFMVVAAFVGMARRFLRSGKVRRNLERITGSVLIGLGLRLAFEKL